MCPRLGGREDSCYRLCSGGFRREAEEGRQGTVESGIHLPGSIPEMEVQNRVTRNATIRAGADGTLHQCQASLIPRMKGSLGSPADGWSNQATPSRGQASGQRPRPK